MLPVGHWVNGTPTGIVILCKPAGIGVGNPLRAVPLGDPAVADLVRSAAVVNIITADVAAVISASAAI